jgi:hypothetical protein
MLHGACMPATLNIKSFYILSVCNHLYFLVKMHIQLIEIEIKLVVLQMWRNVRALNLLICACHANNNWRMYMTDVYYIFFY